MSVRSLACLLLLALNALPVPATAQSAAPGGSVVLLTDTAGDLAYTLMDQPVSLTDVGDRYASLDLTGLDVVEDPEAFTFTLHVADLKPNSERTSEEGTRLTMGFRHNDMEFRTRLDWAFPVLQASAYLDLWSRPVGSTEWDEVYWLDANSLLDPAADTATIRIERRHLADQSGAAPAIGRSLTDIWVEGDGVFNDSNFVNVANNIGVPFPLDVSDRMPDDGFGVLPVALGIEQTGDARLFSKEPFRSSNGAAATTIYTLTAENRGKDADVYTLKARNVPSGWSVALPVDVVSLEAGESVDVPVILSTTFHHDHGAERSFVVELQSSNDAKSTGRIELGLRFTDVPQPSGHHSTVYFHDRPLQGNLDVALATTIGSNIAVAALSTLEADTDGDDAPILAGNYGPGIGDDNLPFTEYRWYARLQPGLQMGMDFDATLPSAVYLPVSSQVPQPAATVGGRIYMFQAEGDYAFPYSVDAERTLAWFNATGAKDIAANGKAAFEAVLEVSEDADLVAYDPEWNLAVEVVLRTPRASIFTSTDAPSLDPGARITLPLVEYSDPVEDLFATALGPSLSALGETQRLVNPGETVLFPIRLTNGADEAEDLVLQVTGRNAEWAGFPAGSVVRVDGLADATATLAVRAPSGAQPGESADLIVQVHERGNDEARALLRLVATVTTDADLPDEAPQAADLKASAKGSPGLAPVLVGAALLALAAVRRRDG